MADQQRALPTRVDAEPAESDASSTRSAQTPPPKTNPKSDSKNDEIWARKVIVSFDGGGMRGYVSLLILEKIMAQVGAIEVAENGRCHGSLAYPWCAEQEGRNGTSLDALGGYRPHHYVDYFIGTSTGGLSSIMLGRLQMTPQEAMAEYNKVGMKVFRNPHYGTPLGLLRTRYSGGKMDRALQRATTKDILSIAGQPELPGKTKSSQKREHILNQANRIHLRDETPHTPRTIVVAYGGANARETYLFRSYDHPPPVQSAGGPDRTRAGDHLNAGSASNFPIWQVGRATSAAPTYFPPVRIGELEFVDGAMDRQNNPVKLGYDEVKQMHPSYEPSLVLSIGTGEKPKKDGGKKWHHWINKNFSNNLALRSEFQKKMLDTQEAHELFEDNTLELANSRVPEGQHPMMYKRFNIPADANLPAASKLDDWLGRAGEDTKELFSRAVDQYCARTEVIEDIRECAERLVEIRRRRAETEEWEQFALHLRYICKASPIIAKRRPQGTSSSVDYERVYDAAARRDCAKRLFMSRPELAEHLEQTHGLIRKVECVDEAGRVVKEWTCFRRQCTRKALGFSSQAQFEEHLSDRHKIRSPQVVTHEEFETLLDRGRIRATEALNRVATSRLQR